MGPFSARPWLGSLPCLVHLEDVLNQADDMPVNLRRGVVVLALQQHPEGFAQAEGERVLVLHPDERDMMAGNHTGTDDGIVP